MTLLLNLDSSAVRCVRLLSLGQTIGNAIAGGIDQPQSQIEEVKVTPEVSLDGTSSSGNANTDINADLTGATASNGTVTVKTLPPIPQAGEPIPYQDQSGDSYRQLADGTVQQWDGSNWVAPKIETVLVTAERRPGSDFNDGVYHPGQDSGQYLNVAYGTKYDPSRPGWHDYRTNNVAIPASLHYSAAQAVALFHKFAVPGNSGVTITNGRWLVKDPFTDLPAGLVDTTISNDGYTVTNETVPEAHILDDGEIVRTLVQNDDGSWSVETHGFGNNVIPEMDRVNSSYGPVVFDTLDTDMYVYATTGELPVVTPWGRVYTNPNGVVPPPISGGML